MDYKSILTEVGVSNHQDKVLLLIGVVILLLALKWVYNLIRKGFRTHGWRCITKGVHLWIMSGASLSFGGALTYESALEILKSLTKV